MYSISLCPRGLISRPRSARHPAAAGDHGYDLSRRKCADTQRWVGIDGEQYHAINLMGI